MIQKEIGGTAKKFILLNGLQNWNRRPRTLVGQMVGVIWIHGNTVATPTSSIIKVAHPHQD